MYEFIDIYNIKKNYIQYIVVIIICYKKNLYLCLRNCWSRFTICYIYYIERAMVYFIIFVRAFVSMTYICPIRNKIQ